MFVISSTVKLDACRRMDEWDSLCDVQWSATEIGHRYGKLGPHKRISLCKIKPQGSEAGVL